MKDDFIKKLQKGYRALFYVTIVAVLFPFVTYFFVFIYDGHKAEKKPIVAVINSGEIKDGIHVASGFIADDGLQIVLTNCTNCHSSKLVIQNRATRDGWESMIRWMQRTQKLWDLGENEKAILDYLSKNYAPEEKGRRTALSGIEWYELED